MIWPYAVQLHSSNSAARWNFGAGRCDLVAHFDAATCGGTIGDASGGVQIRSDDPFELINWMADHPRDGCRWIGFISYGLGRFIERLPANSIDDLQIPLLVFGRFERDLTPTPDQRPSGPLNAPAARIDRSISSASYRQRVKRVLEYIAAGDIFQANFSQRFCVKTSMSPSMVWQRLIARSASAFGALLDFGAFSILSNSPELFFRVDRQSDGVRRIVNRPIKGTRPRGPGMKTQLESSPKDKAELAMIVDLQRNDMGRVCEIGSVRVLNAREIEVHPTLFHGVATIEGLLREDATLSDILRAMFPCGSVTGCPKIRAMEIIDELEPVERGPYCGAIGYIDPDGTIEFNVAIRTMTMKGGFAYIPVGGGIVADSAPTAEYDETLVKAAAMLDALGIDVAKIDSTTF